MLDTEFKLEAKDAAKVLAVGKLLIEAKGKLLKFPSIDEGKTAVCVWSGLILNLTGLKDYRGKEKTHVTCLDGTWIETSLPLDEVINMVSEA